MPGEAHIANGLNVASATTPGQAPPAPLSSLRSAFADAAEQVQGALINAACMPAPAVQAAGSRTAA